MRRYSHMLRQRLWVLLAGIILGTHWPLWAGATTELETRLRAAFLFNFARFTDWPADQARQRFDLCVRGTDDLALVIGNELNGKQVREREVRVRRVLQPTGLNGCQLLYLQNNQHPLSAQWLEALAGEPVLLVGEGRSFSRAGGMVGFFLSEGRLRFSINPVRVRGAGLAMSSRLLNLADIAESRD